MEPEGKRRDQLKILLICQVIHPPLPAITSKH